MPNTLVLIHGLASNATRWWRFTNHQRLPGWTLLRPNLRGHAGSTDRGRIGMRQWCDDIARLLDEQGCERAVIGGHCLGANIALQFAARYPQRTAGLVLIEPMPREALQGTLRKLLPIRRLLLVAACCALALNRLGIHRRSIEAIDLERWDQGVAQGTIDLARYASPLSDLRLVPTAAYLQSLAAVGEPLPALAPIDAPALILLSRNSSMTDPVAASAVLKALPRAQIELMEAEHWIPTEQPEAMRAAIEAWLARFSDTGIAPHT